MHLSAGDLLRAARDSGSSDAKLINEHIKGGKIVPIAITCKLIKVAMEEAGWEKKRFLIDGFPRSQDNLQGWNKAMVGKVNTTHVLYFECDEDTLTKRILKRAETSGRVDDNIETLKKRFTTFTNEQLPIIDQFSKQGLVRRIDVRGDIESIYTQTKAELKL